MGPGNVTRKLLKGSSYPSKKTIMFIFDQNEIILLFDFYKWWQCKIWSHHYVGHARRPYGRCQNHESASILNKIISSNCLLLHK